MQGLLRKDYRARLTRPVVRATLTRVLAEGSESEAGTVTGPRPGGAYAGALGAVRAWGRRGSVAETALALVTVTAAAQATAQATSGPDGGPATGAGRRPSAPASLPAEAGPTAPAASSPPAASSSPPASSGPAPSRPGGAVPAGFRRYDAPEGFSVALPGGRRRLDTSRVPGGTYRVVFGASGDPRALVVTYSRRAGADPVAVWRDGVEPCLARRHGYRRIGAIRATTYRGREAADREWVARAEGARVHTFGRGCLLGGGRSFSLPWTTLAGDRADPGNERALAAFLATFRERRG
ncbi:hypothetical protein ACWEWP_25775 [Streptomyces olivaceus]